jgi:hypothetical protein
MHKVWFDGDNLVTQEIPESEIYKPAHMTDRELMQQALDALGLAKSSHNMVLTSDPPQSAWRYHNVDMKLRDAITALRDRLAQPQRPWVGLTEEDKAGFWTADQMNIEEWDTLFNEIEAALKEKNT